MYPVIISNKMSVRIPYGSTIESSHVATLQLPVLTKKIDNLKFIKKLGQIHSYHWGSYAMMYAPSHYSNDK